MSMKDHIRVSTVEHDVQSDVPPEASESRFSKCRWNLLAGCLVVTLGLFANVVLLGIAKSKYSEDIASGNGIITLFAGDCQKMKRISWTAHLAINVLSTGLLAASNQGMQVLSAPSRAEIDRAHTRGKWVQIGVLGLRNLQWISKKRVLLWLCLGLSSVPIHLFYNSVIFGVTVANDYKVNLVTPTYFENTSLPIGCYSGEEDVFDFWRSNVATFQKLSNRNCIQQYSQQFVSDYANVLLYTSDAHQNISAPVLGDFNVGSEYSLQPGSWICNKANHGGAHACNTASDLAGASSWTSNGIPGRCDVDFTEFDYAIDYCLAYPTPPKCGIELNTAILVLVIVLNVFKLICLVSAFFVMAHDPIITIGDAIASFLTIPDATTIGCGPLSARDVVKGKWKPSSSGSDTSADIWVYTGFAHIKQRWFSGASVRRWVWCSLLCLLTWVICLILLLNGTHDYVDNSGQRVNGLKAFASYGFGTINPNSMVGIKTSLIGNVLIANTPQLLVSLLYLMYNGLFTSMLLSAEWTKFGQQCDALRVSRPKGDQHSTYYLQLPYQYSIPLMVASIGLHWLISQSIFLALVRIYQYNVASFAPMDRGLRIRGLAWSPIALVCALILGAVMILTVWLLALRRYPAGVPLAGSNSVAISAACHPQDLEDDPALREVMYGVVRVEDGVAHATFSAGQVWSLQDDWTYN